MSLENSTKNKKKGSKLKTVENVAMITGKQLALMALIFILLSVGVYLLLRNKGTVSDFFGLNLTTETQTLYSAMYYDDGSNSGTYIPQNVRSLDNTKVYVPVVVDSSSYKDVELSELAERVLQQALTASENSETATNMVNTVSADVEKYSNPSFLKEITDKINSAKKIALTDAQFQRINYLETLVPIITSAIARIQSSLPAVIDQNLKVTDMALTLRSLFRVVAGDSPSESQLVMSEMKSNDISQELANVVMPALNDAFESERGDVDLVERMYAEVSSSYNDINKAVAEQLERELKDLTARADDLVKTINSYSNLIADRRIEVEDLSKTVNDRMNYDNALKVKDEMTSKIDDSKSMLSQINDYIKEIDDISKKRTDSTYLANLAKSVKSLNENPQKWVRNMDTFYNNASPILKSIVAEKYLSDLLDDITKTEDGLLAILDSAEVAYYNILSDPTSAAALNDAIVLEQAQDVASESSSKLKDDADKLRDFINEYADYKALTDRARNALDSIGLADNIIKDIDDFIATAEKSEEIVDALAQARELINNSEVEALQAKSVLEDADQMMASIESYLADIEKQVIDLKNALDAEALSQDSIESNYYLREAKNAIDNATKDYDDINSYRKELDALLNDAKKRAESLKALAKQYPDSVRLARVAEEAEKDVTHVQEALAKLNQIKGSADSYISKAKSDYKSASSKYSTSMNRLSFALSPFSVDLENIVYYYSVGGETVSNVDRMLSSYAFGMDAAYYRSFGTNNFTFDLGISLGADYYLYIESAGIAGLFMPYTRLIASSFVNFGITTSMSDAIDFKFNVGIGGTFNYAFSSGGREDEEAKNVVPFRPGLTSRIGLAVKLSESLYLDVYVKGTIAINFENVKKNSDWFAGTYKQIGAYIGVTYKF